MGSLTAAGAGGRRGDWCRIAGGVAALVLAVLFLLGGLAPAIGHLWAAGRAGWLASFQRIWLVTLFELNAGIGDLEFDALYGLRAVDISIMVLVGVMNVGLYAVHSRTSRVWSLIAAVVPFLGIGILLATRIAGRSGVMGAGLIISLVMARSGVSWRSLGWLGGLANGLLLAGDILTATDTPSGGVAVLVGLGYTLLLVWCFLVGRCLLKLGRTGGLRTGGAVC